MKDSYLKLARRVIDIRIQKDGRPWNDSDEALVHRVARGMEKLLSKTFTVGHASGTAAPGSLTGGSALVQESVGPEIKKKRMKLHEHLKMIYLFLKNQ